MTNRLPQWLVQEIPRDIQSVNSLIKNFKQLGLNTVCQSAHCPNLNSCFKDKRFTFMILGPNCSRNCRFCAVSRNIKAEECTVPTQVKDSRLDEVYNIAVNIKLLGINYAVITSTTRDDIALGGAAEFARLVYLIRMLSPKTKIELLIPDFLGKTKALCLIAQAQPDVIGHNMETVERLYGEIKPSCNYKRSLSIFTKIKNLGFAGLRKSGIMLGFGEREKEIIRLLKDLRRRGCEILTIGQYLAPSKNHYPVAKYFSPQEFEYYRNMAQEMGFIEVYSGPFMRSSFRAKEMYLNTCMT